MIKVFALVSPESRSGQVKFNNLKTKQMKKRLTIVDDRLEIRTLVATYFQNEFEVNTVSNGFELLQNIRQGDNPDLIILDIEMPGLDGRKTLKELKTNRFYKHIPVIMLSSIDESSERISLLSEGADDYLVKPFNPEELRVRIKKIVGTKDVVTT